MKRCEAGTAMCREKAVGLFSCRIDRKPTKLRLCLACLAVLRRAGLRLKQEAR